MTVLEREQTIEVSRFKSKGRNSPFQGMKLKGFTVLAVMAGRIVYRVDWELRIGL